MSYDNNLHGALGALVIGAWAPIGALLRRRRLARIAAGQPGLAEKLGWLVARCWHAMSH